MAIKRDNIHYSFQKIDSYNKTFNFVISAREPGKSTTMVLDKLYKAFKNQGRPSLIFRRQVNHISRAYIESIARIINKFTDDGVQFKYSIADAKNGILDVYLNGSLFFSVVGLSASLSGNKSLVIPNIKYFLFDEFICDPRKGEKYLQGEVETFFEIYNTFRRESPDHKCYFLGNPYSLFNPYFNYFKVNTAKLEKGKILTGVNWAVERYIINPELKKKILAENPLYQFEDEDEDYSKYALEGDAINDKNILILDKRPDYFVLNTLFKIENKYICIYRNNNINEYLNFGLQYYAEELDFEPSKRRYIYCFDLNDLVDGAVVMNNDEKIKFRMIKRALQTRRIAFKNISCYYYLEEIYKFI